MALIWMGSHGARGGARHGWGTVGVGLGTTGTSHRSPVSPTECAYLTVVAVSRWRVQRDSPDIIHNLQMQSVAPVRPCAFPSQQNTRKEELTAPSALLFPALPFI